MVGRQPVASSKGMTIAYPVRMRDLAHLARGQHRGIAEQAGGPEIRQRRKVEQRHRNGHAAHRSPLAQHAAGKGHHRVPVISPRAPVIQLESHAVAGVRREPAQHRRRQVVDMDERKPSRHAGGHRREAAGDAAKQREQLAIPRAEHGRGSQHRPAQIVRGRLDRALAAPLAGGVVGQLRHAGGQRGHQQEPRRSRQTCGRPGNATGAFRVDAVEIGTPRAAHGAGAVNDGIGPGHQRVQRARILEIARQPFDAGRCDRECARAAAETARARAIRRRSGAKAAPRR